MRTGVRPVQCLMSGADPAFPFCRCLPLSYRHQLFRSANYWRRIAQLFVDSHDFPDYLTISYMRTVPCHQIINPVNCCHSNVSGIASILFRKVQTIHVGNCQVFHCLIELKYREPGYDLKTILRGTRIAGRRLFNGKFGDKQIKTAVSQLPPSAGNFLMCKLNNVTRGPSRVIAHYCGFEINRSAFHSVALLSILRTAYQRGQIKPGQALNPALQSPPLLLKGQGACNKPYITTLPPPSSVLPTRKILRVKRNFLVEIRI